MKQTAGQMAREHGLYIREVCEMTGLSRGAVSKWSDTRPALLEAVLRGCREMKQEAKETA